MILPYLEYSPHIHPSVYIAPTATVVGHVEIHEHASIWYNAVIRGDVDRISIGKKTNIQDGCMLHQDAGFPLLIGENVTVGHHTILHGCTIGDRCLIGMGAIILNGAYIGSESLIGAGTLVKEGQEIPPGVLAVGSPARVVRKLTEEEKQKLSQSAQHYFNMAEKHSISQK
ncbi:anhydrase, family 3 protein [Desulforamulus reducens MI-1]|uniref:Anhydrase, family 3 protein n=1 Tax=Desulforamulus reducens (strain ATCC BAA-1160 / DSM 100696 / MI-1) TaxID=349161 RepID=A4J1S1_DESRM|nr:gamma carbonic anhydrase family protein [Desulforamulus reducens]ABO49024.1 anhydrase, family 3 protein [Desulforamulus reducens MI-1]